jgi:hypothetical protein
MVLIPVMKFTKSENNKEIRFSYTNETLEVLKGGKE